MNGPRNAINRHAIETYGRVNVLAELEPITSIDAHSLKEAHHRYFGSVSCHKGNFENRKSKGTKQG